MSHPEIDWVRRAESTTYQVRNLVDGRWQEGCGTQLVQKFSPRDSRLLCQFRSADARDVDESVASARAACEDGRWSKRSVQHRKDVLFKLATLIEAHREELALLESMDVGKPISAALKFDIPAAVATLRFSAEGADKFYGKVYGTDLSNLSYQLRRPMGVVAGIVGWNFPLHLAVQKVGPALATGNCLVLKPSELTSFSAGRLAQLALEAGVPEGVFNVVHGDAAVGRTLAYHGDVDLLTFTGSTQTGKKLLVAAGESNMKRLILECGGKAPNIVFADCPSLEAVAEAIVGQAFWNQGQVCSASSRLLVQSTVHDELLHLLEQKVAALIPGDPLNPQTRFGALVSENHRRKVLEYIESGEREGASLAFQLRSQPPFKDGYYVPPTIFDRVDPRQRVAQEEIFGPVLSVLSFRSEEEAVALANNTIYGLTAVLWTRDIGRAHRIVHGIKAGLTVVNATETPQGGPGADVLSVPGHKHSGVGTEGGIEGLEAYTTHTAVQIFA